MNKQWGHCSHHARCKHCMHDARLRRQTLHACVHRWMRPLPLPLATTFRCAWQVRRGQIAVIASFVSRSALPDSAFIWHRPRFMSPQRIVPPSGDQIALNGDLQTCRCFSSCVLQESQLQTNAPAHIACTSDSTCATLLKMYSDTDKHSHNKCVVFHKLRGGVHTSSGQSGCCAEHCAAAPKRSHRVPMCGWCHHTTSSPVHSCPVDGRTSLHDSAMRMVKH